MTPIRPRDRGHGQGADLRKRFGDPDRHTHIMAAYFAYANRIVLGLGLGITTDGDDLGTVRAESDDVTEWRHG